MDIARQIKEGEKKLKALSEKELTIRNRIQTIQEERKTFEARLGLMRIEENMALDQGMKNMVQGQIKQIVQKLRDMTDEHNKLEMELETLMDFRRQLQEAIVAQKKRDMEDSQLMEAEIKSQEYANLVDNLENLAHQYNQLREQILNRFEEIKALNKQSSELKYQLDILRGIPDAKKSPGHISNFNTQTITLPCFDLDACLLKMDAFSRVNY